MRTRSGLATTFTALAFALPAAALAEDFTFTVPVELNNLSPDINYGFVLCELLLREAGRSERNVSGGAPGRGFPISGGAYRADVTVAVNAAPGVEPGSATHYRCRLRLLGTLRGAPVTYNFDGISPAMPVAAGAPFTPRIEAPVR